MLKHGILGLLSYGSMTGYQVMEVFRDSLSFFWNANTSQIYRDLQTLKTRGLVTDRVVLQQGRPDKKEFSITDAGRDELRAWLLDPNLGTTNFPLLMKVFFAGEVSREENLGRFRRLKASCGEWRQALGGLGQVIAGYQTRVDNPDASLYWAMTLDFGLRYVSMIDEWCDSCIAKLEGERLEGES